MTTPTLLLRAVLSALVLTGCGAQAIAPSDFDATLPGDGGTRTDTVLTDRVVADDGPSRHDVVVDTGPFAPAPHPAFPQVTTSGGPTAPSMQLVVITYPGYEYAAQVEAEGRWIVGSDWLTTVGRDYGVGPGTFVSHVVLTTPAPLRVTDQDIRTMIATGIASGTLPANTPSTLYMVYYPRTSRIIGPEGTGNSCDTFGGYHDFVSDRTPSFAYGVIATCPDFFASLSEEQSVELASAHELIEAATDFDPLGRAAYQLTDQTSPWVIVGGEVADLCVNEPLMVDGFTVQRVWSNTAAAMGSVDPCIPSVANELYFNVSASPEGITEAQPGATLTYTITGFSNQPTTDWNVLAVPTQGTFMPSIHLDRGRINNGGTATLTVQVPRDASGQYGGVLLISSHQAVAGDLTGAYFWPITIVVD